MSTLRRRFLYIKRVILWGCQENSRYDNLVEDKMRLGTRLNRLEKKRGEGDALMAFIGVPDGVGEIFDAAQKFWDKERVNDSYDGVRAAVPWPSYSDSEITFLGLGTYDDLYFGLCGGVRDLETCRFVFLDEVGDLIKVYWQEVQQYMNSIGVQRNDLSLSDESIKIMRCMIR